MAQEWIANAVKNPGSLTAQAKKAGKSITEFCSGQNLDGTTRKRCVLARTLGSFHK